MKRSVTRWCLGIAVWTVSACSPGTQTAPAPDAGGEPDLPALDQGPPEDLAPDAPEGLCEPGEARCRDSVSAEVCAEDGLSWGLLRCRGDERCDEEAATCQPVICVAGEVLGCTGDSTYEYCNVTGTRRVAAVCPNASACTDGRCEGALCTPGQTRCTGQRSFQACLEDGSDFAAEQSCPQGQECADNECQDLCTLNKKISSYIGCEYWSLDLDNYDDAIDQEHAIVVSNPNPELAAQVEITRPDGSPVMHNGPAVIEPLGLGVYSIPPMWNLSPIAINDFSFRVTSNVPVTAHQFNPLNNVDVFSNDGSLLLPVNALGTEYLVMSWQQRPSPPLRGFLTVVNPQPQDVQVTLRVSSSTAPGDGIPGMEPGESRSFTLPYGHVLNMETRNDLDDLTGTEIISELPVAVFGGHECANVDLGIDRCDHIESQLFPVDTWGTRYIASKFVPRGGEPDVWRVLASQDATTIELSLEFTNPGEQVHRGELLNEEGPARFRLNRGEFVEFQSKQAFVLEASAPVGVGHYMVGSNWFTIPRICDQGVDAGNPTGIGDPALTIAVPVEQYRSDYILLVPQDYELDYLNIIAPEGASVWLDEQQVAQELFVPLEGSGYRIASLEIPDGPHKLRGDQPFGLTAYGYDCHVSYAYPGGLNLESVRER